MNPLDALHPKHVDCVLDPLRDDFGRLHFIVLDVDHADTELGFRLEFLEGIQFVVTPPREFEHEVIHVELVEERHEVFPVTFLDGLAAVVSKAKVQRFFAANAAERMVERLVCPLGIFRVAGEVRLIHLNHRRIDRLDLFAQHLGDVHR